jgi:hypothetical protein
VLFSEANDRVHGKLVNAGIVGAEPARPNHFKELHGALAAAEVPEGAEGTTPGSVARPA